jgi:hypothetical protein
MNSLLISPEFKRTLALLFPLFALYLTFSLLWLETLLGTKPPIGKLGGERPPLSSLWFRSSQFLCLIAINVDILTLIAGSLSLTLTVVPLILHIYMYLFMMVLSIRIQSQATEVTNYTQLYGLMLVQIIFGLTAIATNSLTLQVIFDTF